MITLSAVHYIFIIMTILILIALMFKKEIVIPCIVGILLIGFATTHNILTSIRVLTGSLIASNVELFGILLVIALVSAMSRAMQAAGVDELLIRPIRKIISRPKGAYWALGICMLIVSWLIWPSPAIALIGALLLPVAAKVGLPAIWAAVAMNLFGHGIALSSDFFIQGAPAITAKSAGISVSTLLTSSIPLWITMSGTVIIVSYCMLKKDLKKIETEGNQISILQEQEIQNTKNQITNPIKSTIIAILVIASFVTIILLMLKLHIMGSDATALIAGISLILTCVITFINSGLSNGLTDTVDYLKDGFIFAIKIFAPVIVIAAFFFLGSESFAKSVLGDGAPAILQDISLFLSQRIPITRGAIVIIEAVVGVITGLDGSGFSGLPLSASIARTFASNGGINVGVLSALGQITTIWVGGGTLIPWAVVPVAAICGVKPAELARKNLIPVLAGLILTCIVAVLLL